MSLIHRILHCRVRAGPISKRGNNASRDQCHEKGTHTSNTHIQHTHTPTHMYTHKCTHAHIIPLKICMDPWKSNRTRSMKIWLHPCKSDRIGQWIYFLIMIKTLDLLFGPHWSVDQFFGHDRSMDLCFVLDRSVDLVFGPDRSVDLFYGPRRS